MKTFKNKTELIEAINGKVIYLWTGYFFVNVTKKALLNIFPYSKELSGTFEIESNIIRLSFNNVVPK